MSNHKSQFIDSFLPQDYIRENLRINKNTELKYSRTAQFHIKEGIFIFNNKWTPEDPFPSILSMGEQAQLIVQGSFSIFSGSRVYINDGALLSLGSGYINNHLNLSCFKKIEIGFDVAISENVCIRDSDNHQILHADHQKTQAVKIGNHVWVGMNTTILKGVTIGDGAIIAAGAVVNKDIPAHCLAGGIPAKIIKKGVHWE